MPLLVKPNGHSQPHKAKKPCRSSDHRRARLDGLRTLPNCCDCCTAHPNLRWVSLRSMWAGTNKNVTLFLWGICSVCALPLPRFRFNDAEVGSVLGLVLLARFRRRLPTSRYSPNKNYYIT
eukprot:4628515-Amphidinium_carterae.2